jgi:hypothetical protein
MPVNRRSRRSPSMIGSYDAALAALTAERLTKIEAILGGETIDKIIRAEEKKKLSRTSFEQWMQYGEHQAEVWAYRQQKPRGTGRPRKQPEAPAQC